MKKPVAQTDATKGSDTAKPVNREILNDGETHEYHRCVIGHLRKCIEAKAGEIQDAENTIRHAERDIEELSLQLRSAEGAYENAISSDETTV